MAMLVVLASLGACEVNKGTDSSDAPIPEAGASPMPEPEATEAVSILRPDVEAEQPPEAVQALEPLKLTIGFSGGGADLDDAALSALQEMLASEQIAMDGQIVLGGHSDAGGSDTDNERISQARAEQVRDWLIENEIAADRIEIIAFGEQNPLKPNALPDGAPDENGRAVNRRVEIEVALPVEETQQASGST